MARPVAGAVFGMAAAHAQVAFAGMPSINLTDVAAMRVQTISFFLMGLLVSAAVVRSVWNSLARDFSVLPRLSYGKACGVVVLWGLLFLIVLTMISGARELMTPGAWEKQGYTYKLHEGQPRITPSVVEIESESSTENAP